MTEKSVTLTVLQGSNHTSSVFNRGMSMKKLCVFISQFDQFNETTLFPIYSLLLQQTIDMSL